MKRESPRQTWLRAMTKSKTGVVAWVLYALLRSVFAILQIFPIDWNLATARRLAKVWPLITKRHRRLAVEHLTRSFGDELSRDEIDRIADRSLASVAMFAVDVICLPRLLNALTWTRYIDLKNLGEGLELMLSGRGAILVTGHYGSFELMGHVLAALGFDVVAVMRPLDNVYINRFVVQSRLTHGLTLIDKKGAMEHAESVLREGRLLAFIGDQDAGRKGVFVDFFGRPASTYKSIGLLAMATRCPIIVGYARRQGDKAKFTAGVQRVIYPHEWEDRKDALKWITQTYTSALEEIVREDPDQYLWIHRRWKSAPRTKRAGA